MSRPKTIKIHSSIKIPDWPEQEERMFESYQELKEDGDYELLTHGTIEITKVGELLFYGEDTVSVLHCGLFSFRGYIGPFRFNVYYDYVARFDNGYLVEIKKDHEDCVSPVRVEAF